MTSATSERTSSAPLCWRLKNCLKSTIRQDRLIKCLRMHCQKWITTTNDTVKIAKRFPGAKEQRKGHFGKFDHGYVHGCVKMTPPPPPSRFKTLRRLCKRAGLSHQRRMRDNGLWWPTANKFALFKSSSLISKLKLSLSFALCSFFKRSSDFIVENWIQQKPTYTNLSFSKLG